jgi:hypothetical protein
MSEIAITAVTVVAVIIVLHRLLPDEAVERKEVVEGAI